MFYKIAQKFLFQTSPEFAHNFAITSLRHTANTPLSVFYSQNVPSAPVECMGITFPNPVGLAAGMDKDGESIDGFAAMGFGHIEVGTVTPRPQPGNDKPRAFRLKPARAIINRMGFNNKGVDNLVKNIKASNSGKAIIGVNIGKNKTTPLEEGKNDYLYCMDKVYDVAGYIAVNISSPNTPGLRTLQFGEMLDDLLGSLKDRQTELAKQYDKYVPIALKIAPDLSDEELKQVCDALLKYKFDGVIATNTTLDRDPVKHLPEHSEAGGLSGAPLTQRSTEVIRKAAEYLDGRLPIIGVGGIDSAQDGMDKIDAGAKIVQLYTGFIYNGPCLIKSITEAFLKR
ncbi:quinone-dependent dihydroorotate dehydrogenase [Ferrimonas sp. SCSIO 43195]|uniref:quinone-dependent dihydroorotate dehydrogenase n=1 Tax=Ferrimonas sp. SCSIO 43195 TaxID=2822844 RepID=UPI0020751DA7|nr:quinone-dependent dihydroorotate dehydrogenase [Ferrimonas sp. SCSIO 43195]USD39575.1 quinone-dependent dihydroorotate dehydrogenase [Ferrimonas sp. SCSIO 43195]